MTEQPAPEVIDVEPVSDMVNRAVLVAALVKSIMGIKSISSTGLDEVMSKGAKETATRIYIEDGEQKEEKLGTVSKSFPDPISTIVDPEALDAYLRETRADQLECRYVLGNLEEVYAVLIEHAEHLLTIDEVVPQWMVDLAKKEALIVGRKIPGIKVTRPPGVVTIRPNTAAQALAESVLAQSQIPLFAIEAKK
ncbi:hypothetical protein C1M55_28330 [Rhodococcus qingshengii]|uniref:hypothetical protein n=1 Tax=Rhodococcus TaxID=1827 RepID=UPI000C9FF168|nr:hypothetical protein [Rhodococcus qingshengii]AUS34639.1 hypothetical protein C1M55_28330 [Rhodococcus qingshengii]